MVNSRKLRHMNNNSALIGEIVSKDGDIECLKDRIAVKDAEIERLTADGSARELELLRKIEALVIERGRLTAENERLMALLREMPVKHPQQAAGDVVFPVPVP